MSQNQPNPLNVSKRRLMLYKAVQEYPENDSMRSALLRTYGAEHVHVAAQDGIYISYNRADELFALELDTELRSRGVKVWLDQIDVDPDEDWDYAVSNAINRSGVMIIVLSPHSVDDEELQQEVASFMELGKVVVPVIHETCQLDNLDFIMQPIDFSENFKMGLKILLKCLSGHPTVNV